MDRQNGNTLWVDAWNKEMGGLMDHGTFQVLEDGEKVPEGYKKLPCSGVWDVKFDLRRKFRAVAGGHRSKDPEEDVYSGVVGLEAVRLLFTIAAHKGLEVCAGDISQAYLLADNIFEKNYIIAGEDFGPELCGKRLLIVKAWYGQKSCAAAWHDHLAKTLLNELCLLYTSPSPRDS